MKERPIIFNDEMVRAILEGRKTQTRRIMKPQMEFRNVDDLFHSWTYRLKNEVRLLYPNAKEIILAECPFGQPGDRLWVRECWAPVYSNPKSAIYRADGERQSGACCGCVWKPSIHMPRWASRTTLQVTGVRVERLQDIREEDARLEGAYWSNGAPDEYGNRTEHPVDARDEFAALWESIYGDYSWAANPWVWVVEFRRLQ